MTPVEIIALVFAIICLVKPIVVFSMDQKKILNLVKGMFKNPVLLSVVFTAIAVVLGYFLLQELTIVQVFASALFGLCLFGLIAAAYPEGYLKLADFVVKNKARAWYLTLVFIVLAVWVLYHLFG